MKGFRMKKWLLRIVGGFVGVLVLAVAALALMGLRQDAGVSIASIEIAATPEQIWPWIEEPEKFKRWVGWVVSVDVANPEVQGVGRKTVVMMNEPSSPEPVRIESIWTEYQPPTKFSADVSFPGLFTGSQTHQLTDLGNGRTRMQTESRIHYDAWYVRLIEPLATPSSTSKLESDLATLKPLVEAADH
jgi:uncharacterized protein YndB with AHSA1/START domain